MLANMLARFAILYFSKQKATIILEFSFIPLLTIYQECQCEAAACLIIAFMIDDDDKKHVAQQESGHGEERRDVCQPCLGVIG